MLKDLVKFLAYYNTNPELLQSILNRIYREKTLYIGYEECLAFSAILVKQMAGGSEVTTGSTGFISHNISRSSSSGLSAMITFEKPFFQRENYLKLSSESIAKLANYFMEYWVNNPQESEEFAELWANMNKKEGKICSL
jgi:hypothetical protein